ncbi:MAG: hypothetical protein CMI19_00695 [Opitutae bacterium]|nr:hypothetical protein [Opitutae bacterium]
MKYFPKLLKVGSRFIVSSALSFCLNISITIFLCERMNFSERNAFATSLFIVFIINFFLMKYFTFRSNPASLSKQLINYTAFAIGFRFSEYFLFRIFYSCLCFDYRIVVVTVLSASTLLKFFTYKYIFDNPRK